MTIINERVTNGDGATLFKSRYIRPLAREIGPDHDQLKRVLIRPHSRHVIVKSINKTVQFCFSKRLKT